MIHYSKGDLLETPFEYIAHGVNCQGVMGKGIALSIRNKWPKVFTSYRKHCKEAVSYGGPTSNLLGSILPVQVEQNKVVFNLFTQDQWGHGTRLVNYEALYTSFERMLDRIRLAAGRGSVVAIPRIGCNNAGGEWSIVESMIEHLSEKYQFSIHVYDWK